LFSLAGFSDPPTAEEAILLEQSPAQIVREGGETTILAPAAALGGIRERHPQAQIETDLRWIRFEMAMNWDLCGFLAHVTGALAAAEVPLGAVCGFSRDHLFVAEPHLPRTREVLTRLFGAESSPGLRPRP
ncbi:MAG: ACT domain-containing protein, partial [Planctomycetota bacterium]